jgi:hypothetical protein
MPPMRNRGPSRLSRPRFRSGAGSGKSVTAWEGRPGRWPARSFQYLLLDLHRSHRCPGRDVYEGPGSVEQRLDLASLAQEHFELVERVNGLVAAQDGHAGAAATDRVDLGALFSDMTVPDDNEPFALGRLGDPAGIRRGRPRRHRLETAPELPWSSACPLPMNSWSWVPSRWRSPDVLRTAGWLHEPTSRWRLWRMRIWPACTQPRIGECGAPLTRSRSRTTGLTSSSWSALTSSALAWKRILPVDMWKQLPCLSMSQASPGSLRHGGSARRRAGHPGGRFGLAYPAA